MRLRAYRVALQTDYAAQHLYALEHCITMLEISVMQIILLRAYSTIVITWRKRVSPSRCRFSGTAAGSA